MPLPQTTHVDLESDFAFTVSPNDKWLIYYKRDLQRDTSEKARTQLRLLHLTTSNHFEFTVPEDKSVPFLGYSTSCWTENSKNYLQPGFAVLIDGDVPRLITEVEHEEAVVKIEDIVIELEKASYCSDCFEEQFDEDTTKWLKTHHYGVDLSREHLQAVSHDAEKLYFGDMRDRSEVLVCERELGTQRDRVLAKHTGRCAHVDYLRVSPDGQFVAYQFSTGCNFMTPPKLYIIDVESKEQWYVGDEVFYEMHWTSDSKRLYFAQRQPNNGPMQICYVDVPREDAVENDKPDAKPAGSEKPSTNDAPPQESPAKPDEPSSPE